MNSPAYKSSSTASIPFRDEPAVSSSQMFATFAITLLLLGAVWVFARYARRKGWLDRWVQASGVPQQALGKVRIAGTQRISRQTVLYTVEDGGARYLLVESKVNVSMTRLATPVCTGLEAGENEAP